MNRKAISIETIQARDLRSGDVANLGRTLNYTHWTYVYEVWAASTENTDAVEAIAEKVDDRYAVVRIAHDFEHPLVNGTGQARDGFQVEVHDDRVIVIHADALVQIQVKRDCLVESACSQMAV